MASGGDGGEEFGYRPINGVAAASAPLSLLGFVALLNSSLVVVPLFALALAGYGLYAIARSDGRQAGRLAALFALVASLFFAAAAPTQSVVYAWKMQATGRRLADRWFELMQQGKTLEAYQMRLEPGDRAKSLDPQAVQTRYQEAPDDLAGHDRLMGEGVYKRVVELGEDATIRFHQPLDMRSASLNEEVALEYEMRYTENGNEQVRYLQVPAKRWLRIAPDETAGRWQVGLYLREFREPGAEF